MRPTRLSEKSIFLESLDIDSIEDRNLFVESACRGDASLLASVTALLREHERDDNPVDIPIVSIGARDVSDDAEIGSYLAMSQPFYGHPLGTMIGPYKLMEQIGEGGFGLV